MTLVRNRLEDSDGRLNAVPTGETETIPVELVFRSVGYRGVAIPGVPMNESWGVIPNEDGRVVDPETGEALAGLYVSGWIKRGPTGVIGTNKPDGAATARSMLADAVNGRMLTPSRATPDAIADLVGRRQPHAVSFDDWERLDAIEIERGTQAGRPRVKIVSREDVKTALSSHPPE
jgi:ferredoxin--NADP+ reductase